MLAIQQRGYGDPREVLHLTEVEVPDLSADQVLVRVRAASTNPYDWHLVCGEPVLMRPALGGVRAPTRVVGADFAGVVAEVGSAVRTVAPGDEVYGFADGAFAELLAAPAGRLARKPANLTFVEAAAVPLAAITALQGLRRGGLTQGQHVLVLGASGGVGTFAVQLAKHAGSRGHRRVQHEPARPGPRPRRGPRDRLQHPGPDRGPGDVRPDPPARGHVLRRARCAGYSPLAGR